METVTGVPAVNVNKYPLGDMDNYAISRLMLAQTLVRQGKYANLGHAMDQVAPYEKGVMDRMKASGDQITGLDGGFIAPEQWSTQWFDLLRGQGIQGALPVTVIPFTARTGHVARITNDFTITYGTEGVAPANSSQTFAQTTFNFRKLIINVRVSNEEMRDSAPALDQVLRQSGTALVAVEQTKQALIGDGSSGAPLGLINMPQVATAALSATPTLANLLTGIDNVEKLNGSSSVTAGQAVCNGIVGHTQLRKTVHNMTVNGNMIWPFGLNSQGGFLGQRWLLSNTIPSGNSASIIYGDWRWFAIGQRLDLDFAVTDAGSATTFQANQSQIRIITRYDVAAIHPEAFYTHTSAQP